MGLPIAASAVGLHRPVTVAAAVTSGFILAGAFYLSARPPSTPTSTSTARGRQPPPFTPSPAKTAGSQKLSPSKGTICVDGEELPYPPEGALPGGRDVETPYGSIRVYEWGPEDGDRVLFIHGISTPVVALGDLGHEMVARGHRVMMFDLFGRGYSDAPDDLTYDSRLYVTQLLLVLASSKTSWLASPGFRLIGYSLGGGLCVAFTRYFSHLVRSLVLIAPCGLIRPYHVGWRSWLYYNSGLLPEFLVRYLVRRRIRPDAASTRSDSGPNVERAESERAVNGDGDANGGANFDSAPISKRRPHTTVSDVVAWQVDHHEGFVAAFLSTIRSAPIYAPQEDWKALSKLLRARRAGREEESGERNIEAGLEGGKVLIILGKNDGVIVADETMEDACGVLGQEGAEFAVIDGGHEIPFTCSEGVAESIESFCQRGPYSHTSRR
ncbi:alpha/beta-hydrolase [Xylariaceae sp. FL0594]|nr:alpha/beta-hydrolase [Xylariaceae sp. FL0594]